MGFKDKSLDTMFIDILIKLLEINSFLSRWHINFTLWIDFSRTKLFGNLKNRSYLYLFIFILYIDYGECFLFSHT